MKTHFDLAQVIEQFEHQLPVGQLTAHHRRTLSAIRRCRTAALGGHIDACNECGHLRISYNSCRNRHCPKCQGLNQEMWIVQQEDQLLPTTYFHVVFTKKTFAGVHNVVKYLARYSHRVAITNGRILDIDQHHVRFSYKDYAHGAKRKEMMLTGVQFLHRFCLHFLPPRFRKIRQFGFLANACKTRELARARMALALKQRQLLSRTQLKILAKKRLFDQQAHRCPCCRQGQMVIIDLFAPNKDPPFLGLPYLQ